MRYDFNLENRKSSHKKLILQIIITILEVAVILGIAYAITHYGMETFTVSGQDMMPTLENGDRILVNKLSYHLHSVKRNDVVIVRQSGAEHNYYSAERVLGLPGETVQIRDGILYIDGKKLEEAFDFPIMENGGLALEEITLDSEEYFVLCDNRNNGEDSRNASVGNILEENIVGKAWIRLNTIEFVRHINGFREKTISGEKDKDSSEKSGK